MTGLLEQIWKLKSWIVYTETRGIYIPYISVIILQTALNLNEIMLQLYEKVFSILLMNSYYPVKSKMCQKLLIHFFHQKINVSLFLLSLFFSALSKDVLKLRSSTILREAHEYAFVMLDGFCFDFHNSNYVSLFLSVVSFEIFICEFSNILLSC